MPLLLHSTKTDRVLPILQEGIKLPIDIDQKYANRLSGVKNYSLSHSRYIYLTFYDYDIETLGEDRKLWEPYSFSLDMDWVRKNSSQFRELSSHALSERFDEFLEEFSIKRSLKPPKKDSVESDRSYNGVISWKPIPLVALDSLLIHEPEIEFPIQSVIETLPSHVKLYVSSIGGRETERIR